MAVDEVQRIIMDVVDRQKVADLTKEIGKEEDALRGLHRELEAGRISQAAYDARSGAVGMSLKGLRDNLAETSKGMKGWQQNIMGASYALNDFFSVQGDLSQRLGAIANNLPMLLAGFGALGAVLSGIVPIFGMILKNWDELVKGFTGEQAQQFNDTVEGMKKGLEQLEKKKVKLDVDHSAIDRAKAKIDDAKKALDAFEAAKNQRSEVQQQAASEASANIAENAGGADDESGAENLRAMLKIGLRGSGVLTKGAEGLLNQKEALQPLVDQQKEMLASIESNPMAEPGQAEAMRAMLEASKAELAQVNHDLEKFKDEKVAEIIGRYKNGIDAARVLIKGAIDRDPGMFEAAGIGADFRATLEVGGAENIRDRQRQERQQARDARGRQVEAARTAKAIKPIQEFDEMRVPAGDLAAGVGGKVQSGEMTPQAAFAAVKDGVIKALDDRMKAKNIAPDRKAIEAAAEQIARKAIGDDQQARARAAANRDDLDRPDMIQNDNGGGPRTGRPGDEGPRNAIGNPIGPAIVPRPLGGGGAGPAIVPRPLGGGAIGGDRAPGPAPAPGDGDDDDDGGREGGQAAAQGPPTPEQARARAQAQARAQGLSPLKARAAGARAFRDTKADRTSRVQSARAFGKAAKRSRAKIGPNVRGPIAAQGPPGAGQQGKTPDQAAARVKAAQAAFIQQNEINQLQFMAMMEQFMGQLGPATQRLNQIAQRQQAMMRNQQTTSTTFLPWSL